MFAPLDQLPDDSRIWIYQADRALSFAECGALDEALSAFAQRWAAHGAPVRAWAGVKDQHFLVFAADENYSGVSGCSIDSSVQMVREWGTRLGVDFFGRLTLACETPQGLKLLHRDALEAAEKSGLLGPETTVYDHTVQTLGQWRNTWKRPLRQSWAAGSLSLHG
ncbi:MAG: hypothetical protein GC205_05820 [Bacteroidetes bacterium]|nr:hypothetical protein [Bacteroidota bacterium]